MRNATPKTLTESEIDRILATVPSSRERLALMVHLSVVSGWRVGDDDPRLAAFTQADMDAAVRAAVEPLRDEITALDSKAETQRVTITRLLDRVADLQDEIKELEAEGVRTPATPATPVTAMEAPVSNVVSSIVNWIRRTWTTDTVRAKMARQVADRIEAQEYTETDPAEAETAPAPKAETAPAPAPAPKAETAPAPVVTTEGLPWAVVQNDAKPQFFRTRDEARRFARENDGTVRRAEGITVQTEDEVSNPSDPSNPSDEPWGVMFTDGGVRRFPTRSRARQYARECGGKVVDLR